MSIIVLEKVIERGTWRWVGQRVSGISPMEIPIGGASIKALCQHLGGEAYRIGRIQPRNAFVIERPPLRLLYVRPAYTGYRRAGSQVLPSTRWPVDLDHALGRKMAQALGFHYVLLIRIPPRTNRGHGPYERAEALAGRNKHKLCFANQRILDKWIGRPPRYWNDVERLKPYRLDRRDDLGLTLQQAGKWGFAMGVEDDPLPLSGLFPL